MYVSKQILYQINIYLAKNYSCNTDKENFHIKIDIDMYFFLNIITLNPTKKMAFGKHQQ